VAPAGGSQILELTLVLLPALMFVFLILVRRLGGVYAGCPAVCRGAGCALCHYQQTVSGLGHSGLPIQTVVQYNAFGHLNATSGTATGTNGGNSIYVDLGTWSTGTARLTSEDGIVGGNGMQEDGSLPLVAVSVQGLSVNTFIAHYQAGGHDQPNSMRSPWPRCPGTAWKTPPYRMEDTPYRRSEESRGVRKE